LIKIDTISFIIWKQFSIYIITLYKLLKIKIKKVYQKQCFYFRYIIIMYIYFYIFYVKRRCHSLSKLLKYIAVYINFNRSIISITISALIEIMKIRYDHLVKLVYSVGKWNVVRNWTVYVMTESIRTFLTPLFIISYVCGIRIIEFPIGHPRVWFSLFYMLLFWSIYFFLLNSTVISFFTYKRYTDAYFLCIGTDILITLLSIGFGMYHDKVCMIKNY